MPTVGAHVSAAVSLERAFTKAQEIGAEATQIFISPPQQWFQTKHDVAEIERYRQAHKESGSIPNFIHATYLINLGTKNPEHLQKSIDWLIYAMHMAYKMGVTGVIFHTGSHKGEGFETISDQVVNSLQVILEGAQRLIESKQKDSIAQTSSSLQNDKNLPYLILENTAGAGGP